MLELCLGDAVLGARRDVPQNSVRVFVSQLAGHRCSKTRPAERRKDSERKIRLIEADLKALDRYACHGSITIAIEGGQFAVHNNMTCFDTESGHRLGLALHRITVMGIRIADAYPDIYAQVSYAKPVARESYALKEAA